ncbi:MAG: hypothetical protein L0206_02680 [Actinobacteria bacterium]|nr:hypothetical protein [Actinomycetota bacterium]
MFRRLQIVLAAFVLAAVVLPATVASAGTCPIALPQGSDPVTLDPADFVGQIDNTYWPMPPGARWVYRESDPQGDAQKVKVTVTTRTREISGIQATVVHDKVSAHGELVENTFDWYAQDVCGNVWYLGENTKEYEDGQVVSTAGSWEHGVDGAMAGVVVPADPQVGMTYRQEYYEGEAEDAAEILSLDEQAQVPAGHFVDVLLTKDFTPLHPRVLEYKLYAPGVGPVLVFGVSGGSDREALISYTVPS